jgi:hypothetical protein
MTWDVHLQGQSLTTGSVKDPALGKDRSYLPSPRTGATSRPLDQRTNTPLASGLALIVAISL